MRWGAGAACAMAGARAGPSGRATHAAAPKGAPRFPSGCRGPPSRRVCRGSSARTAHACRRPPSARRPPPASHHTRVHTREPPAAAAAAHTITPPSATHPIDFAFISEIIEVCTLMDGCITDAILLDTYSLAAYDSLRIHNYLRKKI